MLKNVYLNKTKEILRQLWLIYNYKMRIAYVIKLINSPVIKLIIPRIKYIFVANKYFSCHIQVHIS